jgi:hypothetical protein
MMVVMIVIVIMIVRVGKMVGDCDHSRRGFHPVAHDSHDSSHGVMVVLMWKIRSKLKRRHI